MLLQHCIFQSLLLCAKTHFLRDGLEMRANEAKHVKENEPVKLPRDSSGNRVAIFVDANRSINVSGRIISVEKLLQIFQTVQAFVSSDVLARYVSPPQERARG
jgi:hypothetical protein